MKILLLFLFIAPWPAAAAEPGLVNDLPVPFNVQTVALNQAVTVTWRWSPPEQRPAFQEFGFEVRRSDGRTAIVPGSTHTDFEVAAGTFAYRVRARGLASRRGRRVIHLSDWSEPSRVVIQSVCPSPPEVTLAVQPTRRSVERVPSVRLRLSGQVKAPRECRRLEASYHVDRGAGLPRSGPLRLGPDGRFDLMVNALHPEDDLPAGPAVFTITATAENEAGPRTSDATTIELELKNPYAPDDAVR